MHDRTVEVVAILTRTPATLRALLEGMPAAVLSHRMAEGTFSVTDVVGHLIHGERTDWVPRIRHILAHGETAPFAPFDRRGFEVAIAGRSTEDLLAELSALRDENLAYLRALALTREQLGLPGLHPALGRVTIGQLLMTTAVHDLNHLDQIARVISHRFADGVGPWRAYLGILDR